MCLFVRVCCVIDVYGVWRLVCDLLCDVVRVVVVPFCMCLCAMWLTLVFACFVCDVLCDVVWLVICVLFCA